LLRRDAVEERELELGRDLRDPRDVGVETGAGVLDRQVDLVRVAGLARPVPLDHRDAHVRLLLPGPAHPAPGAVCTVPRALPHNRGTTICRGTRRDTTQDVVEFDGVSSTGDTSALWRTGPFLGRR